MSRRHAVATLAAVLSVLAVTVTGASAASAPTLGLKTASSTWGAGFGAVKPTSIDYNGDPDSFVARIHWKSWGGARATGTGTAGFTWPGFGVADGTRDVSATVVAYDLGTCGGHPAYRRVQWYFPQYGETFQTSSASFDICTGKSLPFTDTHITYCDKGDATWVTGGIRCSQLAGISREVGASRYRGHSAKWLSHGWVCGSDLAGGAARGPQSVNCQRGDTQVVTFTI